MAKRLLIETPHNTQPLQVFEHAFIGKKVYATRATHDELIFLYTSLQSRYDSVKITVYKPSISFSPNAMEYMEITCKDTSKNLLP